MHIAEPKYDAAEVYASRTRIERFTETIWR